MKFSIPKVDIQKITVLVSLFISICALAASTLQAFIMHKQLNVMVEQQKIMNEQYKASSWARVECIIISTADPKSIEVTLRNAGTGPALVKACKVTFRGKPYGRWSDLLLTMSGKQTDDINLFTSRIPDRTLVSQESIPLMKVDNPAYVDLFLSSLDELSIELCYQTVYGASFLHTRTHRRGVAIFDTQEVNTCSIPAREQMY